jgi:hypothetical protein
LRARFRNGYKTRIEQLIVMIFSGRSNVDELNGNVQELTKQSLVLQGKVDVLSRAIEKQR